MSESRVTKFREVNMARANHVKAWIRRSAMLLPVLGVTWSFGLLTFVSSTVVFYYVFTILNSLQGFFIFINFCILDDTVSYRSYAFLLKTQVLPRGIIEPLYKDCGKNFDARKIRKKNRNKTKYYLCLVDVKGSPRGKVTTHSYLFWKSFVKFKLQGCKRRNIYYVVARATSKVVLQTQILCVLRNCHFGRHATLLMEP